MTPISGLYYTTFLESDTLVRLDVPNKRGYFVYIDKPEEREYEARVDWSTWERHMQAKRMWPVIEAHLLVDEGL